MVTRYIFDRLILERMLPRTTPSPTCKSTSPQPPALQGQSLLVTWKLGSSVFRENRLHDANRGVLLPAEVNPAPTRFPFIPACFSLTVTSNSFTCNKSLDEILFFWQPFPFTCHYWFTVRTTHLRKDTSHSLQGSAEKQ